MREVGRHASTEQLSALLDGRAESDELVFLAGHVEQCITCSHELADLRAVRDLLRALPVYLPPRSFTIPVEARRPARRFGLLIPLTRVMGTVAAVLCVVLFSVDAMQTGYEVPAAVQDSSAGSMHFTTTRSTMDADRAEDAAAKIANAPAAPAAAAKPAAAAPPPALPPSGQAGQARPAEPKPAAPAAAAQPAPGAPAKPQAPAAPPAPQPTSAAFAPGPPAPTAVPGQVTGSAPQPAQAQQSASPATVTSPWLSPIRLWSLAFALIAAGLLIASLVLSRISRTRSGPSDEWSRS
ncbi:MAG TPA: hypothetical protein VFH48_36315 [Chloroflexota bacterium]|nr:hypothetical protein [Chloroflexota bacterium]